MSEVLNTIRWDELDVVGLRTTSEGPFAEDVFWVFVMRDGQRIDVPSLLVGDDVIDVLTDHLPGLDCAKVILAMGAAADRVFRVWDRAQSPRALDRDRLALRFVALIGDGGGRSVEAAKVVQPLLDAWAHPSRHYHTLEHLSDCLRELDDAAIPDDETRTRVELALWYHDVVYEPRAHDNEAKSAEQLVRDGAAMFLPTDLVAGAARCVRATAHLSRAQGQALTQDEAITVDIDLAILGQEPLRFLDFEHAVREEYASVPSAIYFWRRRAFLRGLIASTGIFQTDRLRDRWEVRARENVAGLLASERYRWASWLSVG